jgi:hypothetical protein
MTTPRDHEDFTPPGNHLSVAQLGGGTEHVLAGGDVVAVSVNSSQCGDTVGMSVSLPCAGFAVLLSQLPDTINSVQSLVTAINPNGAGGWSWVPNLGGIVEVTLFNTSLVDNDFLWSLWSYTGNRDAFLFPDKQSSITATPFPVAAGADSDPQDLIYASTYGRVSIAAFSDGVFDLTLRRGFVSPVFAPTPAVRTFDETLATGHAAGLFTATIDNDADALALVFHNPGGSPINCGFEVQYGAPTGS